MGILYSLPTPGEYSPALTTEEHQIALSIDVQFGMGVGPWVTVDDVVSTYGSCVVAIAEAVLALHNRQSGFEAYLPPDLCCYCQTCRRLHLVVRFRGTREMLADFLP